MKKILLLALAALVALPPVFAASPSIERKVFARGLYGKIRIVQSGGDVRVRLVERNEDLRVRKVTWNNPSVYKIPGRWLLVESGPADFTVCFVRYGEDLTVRFVSQNEGPAR